jgi:Asp-tRNA(Asn)/Glu-tRNA(Gln) amidotransferase A subunit family amidase
VHERFDALLCPTLALPALDAGEDYVGGGPTIDGRRLGDYFEMLLTIPFNVAGRCPVLSLPSGRAADGVPTGVQIVGRTYNDDTVFHVGAALERARLGLAIREPLVVRNLAKSIYGACGHRRPGIRPVRLQQKVVNLIDVTI